ncbi:MAG: RluA family pseudouridine synthase [Butyrivibrio sp.]
MTTNNNQELFEDTFEFYITEQNEGERIDKYLSDMLSSYSRSYLQKLIGDGFVLVNNNIIKANYRLSKDNIVTVNIPFPKELSITPENINLDIIYEDEDIILINKPKGMVVHPAAGHYEHTLVNALLYHCKGQLSGINGVMRPGIVHRIDMNTTGIIVACKTDIAHLSLAEQLKEHSITRYYYAICHNPFKELHGTIDAPIGRHPTDRKKMSINNIHGKNAVTHYEVLENFQKYSYIKCRLETGRTHQIRVHMASISHPLLGDDVYCSIKSPFSLQGQTLHAGVLGFVHPRTGKYIEFSAPLPEYFQKILNILK